MAVSGVAAGATGVALLPPVLLLCAGITRQLAMLWVGVCASPLESQLGSLAKRGECQVPSYTAHRPVLFWGSWLTKVAKLSEPPGQWWRLTFLSDLYCLFSSSEKLIPCRTCLRKVLDFPDEWGVAYAVGEVLGSRGLWAEVLCTWAMGGS